jgi:hypothetical protein
LPKNSAGTKQMSSVARTMTQSMSCKCILESGCLLDSTTRYL